MKSIILPINLFNPITDVNNRNESDQNNIFIKARNITILWKWFYPLNNVSSENQNVGSSLAHLWYLAHQRCKAHLCNPLRFDCREEWSYASSMILTLSWRRPLSYRNHLQPEDWFLYDNGLCHERVKHLPDEKYFKDFQNCQFSNCHATVNCQQNDTRKIFLNLFNVNNN